MIKDKSKILDEVSNLFSQAFTVGLESKEELKKNFHHKLESIFNNLELVQRDEFELLKERVEALENK